MQSFVDSVESGIPVCIRVLVLQPVLCRNIWRDPIDVIFVRTVLIVLLLPFVEVDPDPRNLDKLSLNYAITQMLKRTKY